MIEYSVIAVQEHWLRKDNMDRLGLINSDFCYYGISSAVVSSFKKIFLMFRRRKQPRSVCLFGCQDISVMIEKKEKKFYRNWLCQTVLFLL